MSKKLKRASDLIQKQIEEIELECIELRNQASLLNSRADELEIQISELKEGLKYIDGEKIPVERETV